MLLIQYMHRGGSSASAGFDTDLAINVFKMFVCGACADAENLRNVAVVRVICLAVTAGRADEARHIFGRAGVQLLRAAADMPRALQRLLA